MERLTYDFCIGSNHCWQIKGADNFMCKEVCIKQVDDGCTNCPIKKAFDRLAAYENTGLEPGEVLTCKKMAEVGCAIIRLKKYEDIEPIDHLRELAQAEKDGRLVILPDAKYTDADGEKALQKAMWTCGNTNNQVTRYTADAIAEKLCREAMDKNPPLTLEELREMDGEPVWVVPLNDFDILPANYLVNAYAEQMVVDKFGAYLDFEDYGKTWLAYRRRPEEGTV